jgi:hypothetical protein
LTEARILDALDEHGVTYRDRVFGPVTTDARREDHLVRSLSALSPASTLDLMNEVTRILGKLEEGNPQAAAQLPGLPPAERGRPTRTGPLKAGTDSPEMSGPGQSAACERSRGI